MKVVVTALLMLLSIGGLAVAQDAAAQQADYPVCDYSGLRWDTSPTRIEITVFNGEVKSSLKFASLYSFMMFISEIEMAEEDPGELGEFKMLDYGSFGKDELVWITAGGDGPPEMFVVHTLKELPGSESPYMAAFSTVAAAEAKAAEWGGDVYDAEMVMKVLYEIIMEEMEVSNPHGEVGDAEPPFGEISIIAMKDGNKQACAVEIYNAEGVQISLVPTDQHGLVYIKKLAPGTYTLRFSGVDRNPYPAVKTVVVKPGSTSVVRVKLNEAPPAPDKK